MEQNTKSIGIDAIKGSILKPDENVVLSTNENNVYIFFSIDISNSTQLKKEISNWMDITQILYNTQVNNMRFWKYNGDEILYAQVFSEISVLLNIIDDAYITIGSIENKIKKKIGKIVQLKGTVWLARVTKKGPNFHVIPNEVPPLRVIPNEFLGTNVDEGFRLSKKVSGNKVVLDPKIVYFLLIVVEMLDGRKDETYFIRKNNNFWKYMKEFKKDKITSQRCYRDVNQILTSLYFIGYTKLKGIWEERGYPIYWYYGSENDFCYDEQLDNNYISPTKLGGGLDDFHKIKLNLERIFNIVKEKGEINYIFSTFASGPDSNLTNIESGAKLYYSVACIHPETDRILLLKRSEDRDHLRGIWEFPVYAHTKVTVKNYIENRIKEELGIEVELITDNEKEHNIIPIHFCTVYRNNTQHNNLLCIAKIKGNDTEDMILEKIGAVIANKRKEQRSLKYSDCCFIDERDCKNYTPITLEQIKEDSSNVAKGLYKEENDNNIRNKLFPKNIKFSSMYLTHSVHAITEYSKNQGENWWDKYSKNDYGCK